MGRGLGGTRYPPTIQTWLGYPIQSWPGGTLGNPTTIQTWLGRVPPPSRPGRGVTPGYLPSRSGMGYSLSRPLMGSSPSTLGMGYPPSRPGTGYPPLPQVWTDWKIVLGNGLSTMDEPWQDRGGPTVAKYDQNITFPHYLDADSKNKIVLGGSPRSIHGGLTVRRRWSTAVGTVALPRWTDRRQVRSLLFRKWWCHNVHPKWYHSKVRSQHSFCANKFQPMNAA